MMPALTVQVPLAQASTSISTVDRLVVFQFTHLFETKRTAWLRLERPRRGGPTQSSRGSRTKTAFPGTRSRTYATFTSCSSHRA